MARQRSRYAPDAQVRRIARLAAELGITPTALRLGADGSVLIAAAALAAPSAASSSGEAVDAALKVWEASHGLARHT